MRSAPLQEADRELACPLENSEAESLWQLHGPGARHVRDKLRPFRQRRSAPAGDSDLAARSPSDRNLSASHRSSAAHASQHASQRAWTRCRCKMRMSGLSKVEMSGFIGGRGRYGNGANRLEPTRTRPAAGATRGPAEADHAGRSRQAAEDERLPDSSAAVSFGGTRRSSSDPWITRESIKPQVSRAGGAKDYAPG